MCLRSSKMTCYGSNMTQDIHPRRRPTEADDVSQAAGHREAIALTRSAKDVPVRELLVAGGLRGFTEREMFA